MAFKVTSLLDRRTVDYRHRGFPGDKRSSSNPLVVLTHSRTPSFVFVRFLVFMNLYS